MHVHSDDEQQTGDPSVFRTQAPADLEFAILPDQRDLESKITCSHYEQMTRALAVRTDCVRWEMVREQYYTTCGLYAMVSLGGEAISLIIAFTNHIYSQYSDSPLFWTHALLSAVILFSTSGVVVLCTLIKMRIRMFGDPSQALTQHSQRFGSWAQTHVFIIHDHESQECRVARMILWLQRLVFIHLLSGSASFTTWLWLFWGPTIACTYVTLFTTPRLLYLGPAHAVLPHTWEPVSGTILHALEETDSWICAYLRLDRYAVNRRCHPVLQFVFLAAQTRILRFCRQPHQWRRQRWWGIGRTRNDGSILPTAYRSAVPSSAVVRVQPGGAPTARAAMASWFLTANPLQSSASVTDRRWMGGLQQAHRSGLSAIERPMCRYAPLSQAAHQAIPPVPAHTSTASCREVTEEIRDFVTLPCAIGGYSDVHQAVHTTLGRVAVKRPRFTTENRALKLKRLMDECNLLAELNHQHILRCIGYYVFQNTPCIVTAWASNGAMRTYLKRKPESDRHLMLSEVASALNYLHTRMAPVVHGDIHVDNILIDGDGHALLGDFGLSRVLRSEGPSPTRTSVGRLLYQGPEIADGQKLSPASDVFAFSMLIVETYSGDRPLARAPTDLKAFLWMHKGERPFRDEIKRFDFPEGLWGVAEECWAHVPTQRPSMADVLPRLMKIPE